MSKKRHIYVIGSESGPFKIGIAKSLRNRLSGIQTGSHVKISVLHSATVDYLDAIDIERLIHEMLSAYRLSGEWFNVSLPLAKMTVDHISARFLAEKPIKKIPTQAADEPRATVGIDEFTAMISNAAKLMDAETARVKSVRAISEFQKTIAVNGRPAQPAYLDAVLSSIERAIACNGIVHRKQSDSKNGQSGAISGQSAPTLDATEADQ